MTFLNPEILPYPSEAEVKNPAFQWNMEMGYESWPRVVCAHKHHADIDGSWIAEPCEHCGADITGVDYHEPEEETVGLLLSVSVPPGYYVVHPCGHIIHSIEITDGESL